MKQGTNLILTHEEREILSKAHDILLQFETTDAGKETCARNEWINATCNRNSFEVARSVLLDVINNVILKWETPKSETSLL